MIPIEAIAERLNLKLTSISPTERAGPCPDCGGNDRFAINTQKQVFNCRKCGEGGDGLALVRLALTCTFPEALDYLVGASDVVPDPAEIARREKQRAADKKEREDFAARERARAISQAGKIWDSAEGCDLAPVRAYLSGRGITFDPWPPTIRCLPSHGYFRKIAGEAREWHRGPAMISAVWGPDRSMRAVHQTWIDPARPGHKAGILGPDGKAQPAKLTRGSVKGGAIRLSPLPPEGGTLVVGEGIETTASVMMAGAYPGAAFWSGVSLGNMAGVMLKRDGVRHSGEPDLEDAEAFLPPPWLGRLIFLQDGDSAPKETRAKLLSGLRRAMSRNRRLLAEIAPAPEGKDFNDLLKGADDATDE